MEDSFDRVEKNGTLEDSVEAIIHSLEKGVESTVYGICSVGYIAKNIVVDVVTEACNDTVGIVCPAG